jgi:hypothetical protein
MKKLLFMAFLAVGMTANAETFVDDDDDNAKEGLELSKDEDESWSMHLQLGVDIPTGAPDGVDFAPFRSWEFQWTILQYGYTPKNTKTTFSVGMGFNWRNYTLSGHDKMFSKVNDVTLVTPSASTMHELSSSIHTTSLSMPLLVKQRFSKDFALSLGAQLNYNFHGRVINEYEHGDDDVDISTKKIGERPFTVDLLGIVHVCQLGFYCKYSPMSVLKKDRGPEFKSLAVGIYF